MLIRSGFGAGGPALDGIFQGPSEKGQSLGSGSPVVPHVRGTDLTTCHTAPLWRHEPLQRGGLSPGHPRQHPGAARTTSPLAQEVCGADGAVHIQEVKERRPTPG